MRIYLSENHKDVQRTVHNTLYVILLLAYNTDNPFVWLHHFIYIKSKSVLICFRVSLMTQSDKVLNLNELYVI